MVPFLLGPHAVKPQMARDVVCEMSSHVAEPFQFGISLLPHFIYLQIDLPFPKDGS